MAIDESYEPEKGPDVADIIMSSIIEDVREDITMGKHYVSRIGPNFESLGEAQSQDRDTLSAVYKYAQAYGKICFVEKHLHWPGNQASHPTRLLISTLKERSEELLQSALEDLVKGK